MTGRRLRSGPAGGSWVRDYERLPAHHETYIYSAMIIVMTRRLAGKPEPVASAAEPKVT